MSKIHPQTPYFDITVNPKTFDDDVIKLFAKIRPKWEEDQLEIKSYSEGFVNVMKRCHVVSDENLEDAIVVRVYGHGLDDFVSRDREIMAMQLAYAAGCFQPILAIFNNGVAYKHAPGRTLTPADLNHPAIIKLATEKLAKLSTLDVDSVPLLNSKGENATFSKEDSSEAIMKTIFEQFKTELDDPAKDKIYQKYMPSKNELFGAIPPFMMIRNELNLKHRMAHGDFHPRNIIYDEQTDEICLIDYELSEFKSPLSDLTYLFTVRVIMEFAGVVDPQETQITEEARELWIQNFLDFQYRFQGGDPAELPEAYYEFYSALVEIGEIGHSLFMMLFIGAKADDENSIQLDYLGMLPVYRKKWDDNKHKIPDLVEKCKQRLSECAEFL